MTTRQITTPLIIDNDVARPLTHIPFGERRFTEGHLQAMLFEHPALLPTAELEPVFDDLIPVCRELPTSAGPLDLLYMTSSGNLCLVETKLWRNPESRRSVVAQLLDYAKEIAGWSYTTLAESVRRSRQVASVGSVEGKGDESLDVLAALAADESEDFEQDAFIDAVSRKLRLGRFLLLIVGDGIREDVEQLAGFLQQTPQLGFTLGLIEIGLYRVDDNKEGPVFVQPRILARTAEVTRAVVEVRNHARDDVAVGVTLPTDNKASMPGRQIITEQDFLEQLATNAPQEAVDLARWVLDNAEGEGLSIEWGGGGPLIKFADDAVDDSFTFAQLDRRDRLSGLHWLGRKCRLRGLPDSIARNYLEAVADCVPGAGVYDDGTKGSRDRPFRRLDVRMGPRIKSDRVTLEAIAPAKERWFQAIRAAMSAIQHHTEHREP